MSSITADRFNNFFLTIDFDGKINSETVLKEHAERENVKYNPCIKLDVTKKGWMDLITSLGFHFWHSKGQWLYFSLSKKVASIPIATHSPGVAVISIRGKTENEILLVEEANRRGILKLVTGCVEANNTLKKTVEEEVFQETGYSVTSAHMIPFIIDRPMSGRNGTSDLIFHFVAVLKDPHNKINIQDTNEIYSAHWVSKKDIEAGSYKDYKISEVTKNVLKTVWDYKIMEIKECDDWFMRTNTNKMTCYQLN